MKHNKSLKHKTVSKVQPRGKVKNVGRGFASRAKDGLMSKALMVLGTPQTIKPSLKEMYQQGRRKEVISLFLWELRYKLNTKTEQTTTNPFAFCKTTHEANHFIGRLLSVSKSDASKNGIFIATNVRSRLNNTIEGSLAEKDALRNRIDDYLRREAGKGSGVNIDLDPKLQYEVQGRHAFDADVQNFVSESLKFEIEENLTKQKKKRGSVSLPSDLNDVADFYQRLDNSGCEPFLCSHTLLAATTVNSLFDKKREIHLGVCCSPDNFVKIFEGLVSSPDYNFPAHTNFNNCMKITLETDLTINVWRYADAGAYFTVEDSLHESTFSKFNFKTTVIDHLAFRVPADTDLYLQEQFGLHWQHEKLYNYSVFDYANNAYKNTPEALEFLTKRIVTTLSKNHRRIAARAVNDLNDYFNIDFTPYIPVSDFFVDTPAERQRKIKREANRQETILIVSPTLPNSSVINFIANTVKVYGDVKVAYLGTPSFDQAHSFLLISGVIDVLNISDLEAWEAIATTSNIVVSPTARADVKEFEKKHRVKIGSTSEGEI